MPFSSPRRFRRASALLPVVAAAALPLAALAQPVNTITTAVPILTLSPDSRGAALGEAGAATSPDANAAFYNPGKLGFVPFQYSASPSYTPWLRSVTDDMGLAYLSGYGKIGARSAVSASLLYFDLGQIEYRTNQNQPNGTFNPREYAVTVSYGTKLSDNFGVGLSGRYIRSNLTGGSTGNDPQPGNAFALDFGAYYTKDLTIGAGIYNLSLGAAISNIGNKITYTDPNNPSFLPTNLKVGTAITRELDAYNKITLVFDANKLLVPTPWYNLDYYNQNGVLLPPSDPETRDRNREIQQKSVVSSIFSSFSDAPGGFKEELREINLSTGLEYWYNDLLAARVGYFYEAPTKGDRQYLSLGLGVRYQVFGVDGAYLVPNSKANPLSQTIRVSLHLNFNKLSEAFNENGAGGTQGTLEN